MGRRGRSGSAFYLQHAQSGRWTFGVTGTDTLQPQFSTAVSGSSAVLNQWTHLAGVYNATNATITLYVNGKADPTIGTVSARTWNATGPLVFGRSKFDDVASNYWPGDIDDIRVLAGAVTAPQIAALNANTPS